MSKFYSLAYAVGFTPWEKAGQAGAESLTGMFAREEAEHGGPGKALDLGCGSGAHLVTLARRGWTVTGVDLIGKALERALQRIADSGVHANVVRADVTMLPAETVGTGFDFFLDLGCFHGLNQPEREAMARAVTARARPEATLLMLAFGKPAGPPFMPQGATSADIAATYGEWLITDAVPAPVGRNAMPKFARKAEPTFYRLRRR